jgi:predicted acyl esterase
MPDNGYPAFIFCHGYADSKYAEFDYAFEQAHWGYVIYCYSMRGQGNSEGESNLISLIEMNDLLEVIKCLKQDYLSHVDPTRVGITGSSQGGIIPFMAACNGADVRMIMSDLASSQFASNWIENGCIKTTLYFSVDYDSTTVRYDNECKNILSYIYSKDIDKWDSLAAIMPVNRDFIDRVPKCKIPILITNAWMDEYFNATGSINIKDSLKSPYRMYLGAIDGHGSDTTTSENDYLTDMESDWIDYWSNDIANGILDSAKYIYASSHYPLNGVEWDFSRFYSDTWAPPNITSLKLYFNPSNILGFKPTGGSADTVGFDNDVEDTTATMEDITDEEFWGPDFDSVFVKTFIFFESQVLKNDIQMIGVPQVNLNYSSDGHVCQYNFQVWEVIPLKGAHLVTRVNYTDRHNNPGELRQKLIGGWASSHIFQKGNRIRVIVTNLDTQPADSFLVTNPYVLPVLEPAHNLIYMNKDNPTYLDLPINGTYDNVEFEPQTEESKLIQVYPNPFTSETDVNVSLEHDKDLIIDLYDALGNKIKHLHHGRLTAGFHDFYIDGKNLTTGVYFIRASGENFSELRKIVLMK